MPLVEINHRQPISHMSKIIVHCYYSYDNNIKFAIGYMINTWLKCNKILIDQVEKCLSISFNEKTVETIKDCLRKKITSVMALILFYENNGLKPKKLYIVLCCVVYSNIINYVCIKYI